MCKAIGSVAILVMYKFRLSLPCAHPNATLPVMGATDS